MTPRPSAPFFISLAFSLLAAAPLSAPGYFSNAHDARHSVFLMQMFDATFRDGALVPRWGAEVTFGYGYPVWNVFAPLPYYAAELVHLAGFDLVASVKWVYFVSIVGAALAMYLYARRLAGPLGGMVAATAYTFVPYHIVDLYVRAAWPESVSFVFFPLVLWGLHRLMETGRLRYLSVAALAYGALLLTHIIMSLLFSLVIGGYILLLWALRWRMVQVAQTARLGLVFRPSVAILLGLGIGALFWMPSILEQPFLHRDTFLSEAYHLRTHFLNASQLFSPFWGYGYAGTNGNDQFSLQLGIAPFALALVSMARLRVLSSTDSRVHALFWGAVLGLGILGTLPISLPLWELGGRIGEYVQFPWRLLAVTATAMSVLVGLLAARLAQSELPTAFLLCLALILPMWPVAQPQYTEAHFGRANLIEFQIQYGEILGSTVWTRIPPKTSPIAEGYLKGDPLQKAVALDEGHVELISTRPSGDLVRVDSASGTRLMFYTHYFPGWNAFLDGQPTKLEPYGDYGLILVNVPPGSHTVETRFGYTPPRAWGELITLSSLVVAAGLLAIDKRSGYRPNP